MVLGSVFLDRAQESKGYVKSCYCLKEIFLWTLFEHEEKFAKQLKCSLEAQKAARVQFSAF